MSDAHHASLDAPSRSGLIALLAAAARSLGVAAPAQAGKLYLGVSSAMVSSDLALDFTAAKSGTINGLVQDDPRVAPRFLGGYYLTDWLAVEGGYNDVDAIFAAVGTDNYHFDITGIDLSAVFRLPLGTILGQQIGFYAKAGGPCKSVAGYPFVVG